MTRDPRLDPRPGDVLRMPSGTLRAVWKFLAGGISYRCIRANGEDFGPGWCRLDFWEEKMRDATVLTVAPSREEGRG